MCIRIRICLCLCICICICRHVYVYTHIHILIYRSLSIHIYIYTHIHTSIYVCVYMCVYIYIYIQIIITLMHIYIYIYIFIYICCHQSQLDPCKELCCRSSEEKQGDGKTVMGQREQTTTGILQKCSLGPTHEFGRPTLWPRHPGLGSSLKQPRAPLPPTSQPTSPPRTWQWQWRGRRAGPCEARR